MSRPHITRIDGSPGAGKTHQLKNYLKRERDENGVRIGDFRYITFTNAGRDDAVTEVMELFDGSREDIETSVRTLHSVALVEAWDAGIVEDPGEQIITQQTESSKENGLYESFARRHGMHFQGRDLRDTRERDGESGTADTLFQLNEWLTLTRKPAKKARQAPVPLPWSTSRAKKLLDAWDDYKRTARPLRQFEHMDYLDEAITGYLFPSVDVLFIDEFQDFSPQEYLYYKLWRDSGNLSRVYLAGDPNQSIYSFRAGTPFYFEETDASEDVYLSETYRCRSAIADYARSVLNVGPGADTDFNAHFDGGTVKRVDGSRDAHMKAALENALTYESGAFMLARTNSKVWAIRRWLQSHGYPYHVLGTRQRGPWSERMTQMLNALRTLQRGSGGVSAEAVHRLMAHTPQSDLRKQLLDRHGDAYTIESVWKAFTDVNTVGQIVAKLDFESWKRDALRAAANRPAGNSPDELAVGTIHAAKGLERPAVLLFNSYNSHIETQYHENMDIQKEEHRVAYVGATRASKRLLIVNGFFDGPRMTPLERATGVVA
ncbi:UvrD-helicase domain-containing protein [Halobacteriaceae archaeon GCM10025711]